MYGIFLVETKSKSKDSDYIYIKSVIRQLDKVLTKYDPVYLSGKTNYNKKEKQIEQLIRRYCAAGHNVNEVKVFMCIDVDNITTGQNARENRNLNERIERYCQTHNYKLVWFYEDIESVFIGKKVPDNEKTKQAENFLKSNMISKIGLDNLKSEIFDEKKKNTSNLVSAILSVKA